MRTRIARSKATAPSRLRWAWRRPLHSATKADGHDAGQYRPTGRRRLPGTAILAARGTIARRRLSDPAGRVRVRPEKLRRHLGGIRPGARPARPVRTAVVA